MSSKRDKLFEEYSKCGSYSLAERLIKAEEHIERLKKDKHRAVRNELEEVACVVEGWAERMLNGSDAVELHRLADEIRKRK